MCPERKAGKGVRRRGQTACCLPSRHNLNGACFCAVKARFCLLYTSEVRPNLEAIVARSRSVAETMSKGVRFLLNKNKIDLIPRFGRLSFDFF